MSKNKHGDLFNTSLTEIIIILFFVLMLFALFNIDKVNKENRDLGIEIDEKTTQLIIEKERADKNAEIANSLPVSQGPLNIELTLEIAGLKQKINNLEQELERLMPSETENLLIAEETPIEETQIPEEDSLIAGNCIDKKFWRQCAEWAWPLDSEPPFEYLFDIGMCSSGDIVVIRSEWRQKKELDFILVDGALTITNKMYIKRDEIKSFMSLIHDQTLDFQVGQTQHAARLINLESIDTDTSISPRKTIEDHMKFDPYPRGSKRYQEIEKRFPTNACNAFLQTDKEIETSNNKDSKNNTSKEKTVDIEKVEIPEIKESIKPSNASFIFDQNFRRSKCLRKRTPPFKATFYLSIKEDGRAKVKSYTYEKTNRNNRSVVLDVKSAIERQRKNVKAPTGVITDTNSSVTLTLKFNKDVCL